MNQGKRRGLTSYWLSGSCAVLGLILLAACGGASKASSSNSNGNDAANNQALSTGACDQMTKVMISGHMLAGKASTYAFTPNHVIIKAGEFITFSNQSDEVHVLQATPDAALANSAIDRNEDQPVQFPKAGTYTLISQDAKHRGSMQVIVEAANGTTCGISAPATTLTFSGNHVQGQSDPYALTPKTISLNVGQTIALLNKSSQALNFSCKPSAEMTEGNLRVDTNEQQIVQFSKAGQYTCTSTEAPGETVAVNVH
ncbi:MAG TPA: hypothetical protein VGD98_22545 [Ktedonobacteraceae bacterium]